MLQRWEGHDPLIRGTENVITLWYTEINRGLQEAAADTIRCTYNIQYTESVNSETTSKKKRPNPLSSWLIHVDGGAQPHTKHRAPPATKWPTSTTLTQCSVKLVAHYVWAGGPGSQGACRFLKQLRNDGLSGLMSLHTLARPVNALLADQGRRERNAIVLKLEAHAAEDCRASSAQRLRHCRCRH